MNVNKEKNIFEKLMAYQFDAMDKRNLGQLSDVAAPKEPIIIIGPTWNDEKLRAWTYGGNIAFITKEEICELTDSKKNGISKLNPNNSLDESIVGSKLYDYGKYIIDGFLNNRVNAQKFELTKVIRNKYCTNDSNEDSRAVKDKKKYGAYNKYVSLLKEKDAKSLLEDEDFLELVVYAAYNRFLTREDGYDYPVSGQEKCKQNLLAKESMTTQKYNPNNYNMVVMDIEFIIPLVEGSTSNPRADFVVFDGSSFGLVEFKYLGYSMNDKNNNLTSHYDDFRKIRFEKDVTFRKGLIEELVRRMNLLIECKVIDPSWKEPLNKLAKAAKENYDETMLWNGFYFLGDGKDTLKKSGTCKDIEAAVKKQIQPIYNKDMLTRYQYSKLGDNTIRMDRIISSVWEQK